MSFNKVSPLFVPFLKDPYLFKAWARGKQRTPDFIPNG